MGAAGLGVSGLVAGICMKPDLGGLRVAPFFVRSDRHYLDRMEQDKTQFERFKEAARELGTDNEEERFNERLKKLVKQKPKESVRCRQRRLSAFSYIGCCLPSCHLGRHHQPDRCGQVRRTGPFSHR